MNELIVATGNNGKMDEIRSLCADIPVSIRSLKDLWQEVPDIPETGVTFRENALLKAAWVFSRKKIWTLADDSGLEVDALQGAPGVHSARYAGELRDDAQNIRKLMQSLAGVPKEKRGARFRCVMALVGSEEAPYIVEGVCEGSINDVPRGTAGFGYDPVFVPRGYTRTFAEINREEKNRISHRGKALTTMKEVLYERFGTI
jgi:XTP/dITP diphosphohydrolase